MHPTRLQRLFAGNAPLALITWLCWIALTAWIADGLRPLLQPSHESVAHFGFLMLVTVLFAFIVACIAASIVIDPINTWRGRRNGAPYAIGDDVRILAGPHGNRVVPVRAIMPDREQVTVELNDGVTETYPWVQVCRERPWSSAAPAG